MRKFKAFQRSSGARLGLIAATGLVCLPGLPAFGQTVAPTAPAPAPVDAARQVDYDKDIVVTGTRIRGQAPVGTHLIAIDQQKIEDTGLQTTADVIRSLPQVSNLGANEMITNSAAGNSALNVTRANGINLRGLGPIATLVLIDGHRPVPEGQGAQLYDPSSIPAIALERIEVVPDGGSAIYGADAVAGVVNVITRKNFNGLELQATGTGADDYRGDQFSGIFGHKWNSGSFMIAGSHDWHSRLQASDRAGIYNSNLTGFGGNNQNIYTNNVCEIGGPLKSCPTSSSTGAYTAGTNIFGIAPGGKLSATPNTQSAFNNQSILPATQRTNVISSFHQDIGSAATVRVEAFYVHRTYDYNQADTNFIKALTIAPINPTYSPIPGYAGPESVSYDFTNLVGPADRKGYEVNYQIDGGLDFKLPHDFKLAADILWGRDIEQDGSLALNANVYNPLIASGALNVTGVGPAGTANAASIVGLSVHHSIYESTTGSLHLDGPLFGIGGGDVSLATGAEIKGDTLHGLNYNTTGGPNTATIAGVSVNNDKRNSQSLFAELLVPLVGTGNAMPGIRRLELNIADRYDHFSDFGGTNNPKFAVRYDPVEGLSINANYGTSFRAPTLAEKDPAATPAAFYNNPAFYTGTGGNCPNATCSTIMLGGGNANITPEKARTWSVGANFQPVSLPGFAANVTFFHIKYTNIIGNPGSLNPLVETNPAYAFLVRNVSPGTNAADLAYVQSLVSSPLYSGINALTPAQIAAVTQVITGTQVNAGGSKTSGIDFAVGYHWAMGAHQFNLGVSGEYLTQYDYELVPGLPFVSDLNLINFPLKFHGRLDAGWAFGGLRLNGSVNYVGSYTDNISPGPTGTLGSTHVSPYVTTDLTIAYDTGHAFGVLHDTTFSLSAQNLFNVKPPVALNGNYSYDSAVANPLLRELSFTVRKKF